MLKSWHTADQSQGTAVTLSVENWVLVHLLTLHTSSSSWELSSQCLAHFGFRMLMTLVLKTQVSPTCHHLHTHEYSFPCSFKGLLCRWMTGLYYHHFQCQVSHLCALHSSVYSSFFFLVFSCFSESFCFLLMWSQVSYFTSLCLSSPICKRGWY